MRKSFLIILFFFTLLSANAQQKSRIAFASGVCLGKSVSVPSCTPFEWHAAGLYQISNRLSVGAGTGVACYEKTLLPVYADVKYIISKPHFFTSYVECQAGYGFEFSNKANGGVYINPSIGVQHALNDRLALTFSLGYEIQNLERQRTYENEYYKAEFAEKLNHSSISFRIGLVFN